MSEVCYINGAIIKRVVAARDEMRLWALDEAIQGLSANNAMCDLLDQVTAIVRDYDALRDRTEAAEADAAACQAAFLWLYSNVEGKKLPAELRRNCEAFLAKSAPAAGLRVAQRVKDEALRARWR